jgi:hypothetical protein
MPEAAKGFLGSEDTTEADMEFLFVEYAYQNSGELCGLEKRPP